MTEKINRTLDTNSTKSFSTRRYRTEKEKIWPKSFMKPVLPWQQNQRQYQKKKKSIDQYSSCIQMQTIPNKILANRTQRCIKRVIYYNQVELNKLPEKKRNYINRYKKKGI